MEFLPPEDEEFPEMRELSPEELAQAEWTLMEDLLKELEEAQRRFDEGPR
jgi:hypothetical protein